MATKPTEHETLRLAGPSLRTTARPRKRPAVGDRATVAPQPTPPQAMAMEPPRPPRRWPTGAALVLLPVIVAVMAGSQVELHFAGTSTFAIASLPGANETATANGLEPYRRELVDVAWLHSETAGRVGSARPVRWSVGMDPQRRELTLSILDMPRERARTWLEGVERSYVERLRAVAQRHLATQGVDERFFSERQAALDQTIADLASRIAETSTDEEAPDPLATLDSQMNDIGGFAGDYATLRSRLSEASSERNRLRHAPVPTAVTIDPDERGQAYEADEMLQEDLRHLAVQLAQVRAGMLEVWQQASARLDDIVAGAEALSRISSLRQATVASDEHRRLLERLAESASDFHSRATVFAQAWTRGFTSLQAMQVDPDEPIILNLYEQIAKLVRDYQHESSTSIAELRIRLMAMTEHADEQARHHVLTATATRQLQKLIRAQEVFDEAAGRLTARDNYLLDAALQSARGLMHRTRTTRRAIDEKLEEAARQRVVAQRKARIEELERQIESIRGDIDLCVQGMVMSQEQARSTAAHLPEQIEQRIIHETSTAQREMLDTQRTQVAALLASARRERSSPVDPDAVHVIASSVSERPTNLPHLLTIGALAWSVTFALVLGVISIRRRSGVPM